MLDWLFWVASAIFVGVLLISTQTPQGFVMGCGIVVITVLVVFLGLVA